MIFFQACPDIFTTKLKKSYAFIQDKIEKKFSQKKILNVPNIFILVRKKIFWTELITEQLLHSEFDYSKNPAILTEDWDVNYRIFRLFKFNYFQQIIINIKA